MSAVQFCPSAPQEFQGLTLYKRKSFFHFVGSFVPCLSLICDLGYPIRGIRRYLLILPDVLVGLSVCAPACSLGQDSVRKDCRVFVSGSMRALPLVGVARSEERMFRAPSTPFPKIQAKAPMRVSVHGSFLDIESPRGGVPRRLAVNKKEKSCGKIESSLPFVGVSRRRVYVVG